MKSVLPGMVPRSQQRWLFAGLGMVFAVGLLQQLLFPVLPPLATLSPTLPLPNGWYAAGDPAGITGAHGGGAPASSRELRFGVSRRWTQAPGGWVVITPISTWDLKALDADMNAAVASGDA